MNRIILAGLIAIGAAALFAYVLLPYLKGTSAVDQRIIRRQPGLPVVRLPELVPSSGLAWSVKQYPEQYAEANRAVADLTGLDDYRNERFLDVGARAYAREFNTHFSYTDPSGRRPTVRVEYLRRAETFAGKLVARGLKPNFAYQVKLRGIFADREAFERIGHVGRWRLPGPGTNYLDSVYEAYPQKELVESYLLFDFFVTDATGATEKPLYLDSTLHVLWSHNHQRIPRPSDTRPVRVVREGSNLLLYASARPDLSVQGIFAESEQHSLAPNNRPPVNEAFLPPGRYRAEIALTEESFHGYGDSGFWATVMSGVVEFDVVDRPRPTPYWTALESQGFRLSLSRAAVENIRADRCTDAELAGAAITDKPVIAFAEEFNLSPGRRHVLALEFRSRGRQAWQVYVDRGQELSLKPEYYVESDGRGGWQRFELEITSQARGYLRIAPTNRAEKIGVRNVGIHPVKE